MNLIGSLPLVIVKRRIVDNFNEEDKLEAKVERIEVDKFGEKPETYLSTEINNVEDMYSLFDLTSVAVKAYVLDSAKKGKPIVVDYDTADSNHMLSFFEDYIAEKFGYAISHLFSNVNRKQALIGNGIKADSYVYVRGIIQRKENVA